MMHRNHFRRYLATVWRYVVTTSAVSLLVAGIPSPSHAQIGGMGGTGGMGGAGSMGRGGMRGGRGAPPGAGNRRSPAAMMRERLKAANTLEFLLEHKKPLALTKLQQDSIKHYRKDVERLQKPLFAALEDAMNTSMPPGGRRGTDRRPNGDTGDGTPGFELADRLLPDSARTLLKRLEDIQQAFGDRARAQLDSTQLVRADSIQSVKLAEQRAKATKLREEMERRRRG